MSGTFNIDMIHFHRKTEISNESSNCCSLKLKCWITLLDYYILYAYKYIQGADEYL